MHSHMSVTEKKQNIFQHFVIDGTMENAESKKDSRMYQNKQSNFERNRRTSPSVCFRHKINS